MAQITYENKVKINDSSLPAVNKVRDVDMNEIKAVVNENEENFTNSLPIVLFENDNGVRTNINLNDSSANYTRIDIQYLMEDEYDTTIIYSPNEKKVILSTSYVDTSGWFQISSEEVIISGSQITRGSRNYVNVSSQGATSRGTASSSTLITKVIGYK